MRTVPGVFIASDGSGIVTHGHRVLCAGCDHDSFQINVIYLTNGEHTHLACSRCGACFCDNRCMNGESMVPPAQAKDN